jgi:hypothetical protein
MPQIMIVLGVIVALVAYLADVIGLGTWQGLGWRHLIGVLFGLILVVNGLTIWAIRERRE